MTIFIDNKYYNKNFNQMILSLLKMIYDLRKMQQTFIATMTSIFLNNLIFDYVDIYLKVIANNLNI